MLYLGLDVGSTTVKAVVMDPQTQQALLSRYVRHNAYQARTVQALLAEIFAIYPEESFRAAVCGSGGKVISEILAIPYIQEVVANSIAVRRFYPETSVAVELGGQDAKIVFFYKDAASGRLSVSDMRMNGSCAGGTGAFLDEVASLLKIPIEEFDAFAAKGSFVYDISGRCGVFAKTDIQPLLNQGCRREDIALSTLHAITKQTIGGLAQGLEITAPVIFEGGPLTFNPTLIRVFAERLSLDEGGIIRPQNSETLVALGAALSIDEMFNGNAELDRKLTTNLTNHTNEEGRVSANDANRESKVKAYFESEAERRAFDERYALPPKPSLKVSEAPPKPGLIKRICPQITQMNTEKKEKICVNLCPSVDNESVDVIKQRVYLGIDAGSTTTKFVLLDEEERLVDSFYAANKGEPLDVIKEALLDLRRKYIEAGLALDIIAVGTTGYGEHLFFKALGADYHAVETVAHAAAAQKYVPEVSFILDIGGQDMKAINIADGIVTNITLNEACSSGCGSFLENFASSLNIPVEKIAETAFAATNPAELGSRCTVFMNSCIITEQKNGKGAGDIMAGLCRSIIENVFTKVVRISNFASLGSTVVVQGGTFKNDAVLRALEQYAGFVGKKIIRAPYPGEMGAIGIALLTKRYVEETLSQTGKWSTSFIGLDAMENFSFTQESKKICPFCANNCSRTLISFSNGTMWVTGNRCKRGEVIGRSEDHAVRDQVQKIAAHIDSVPDMFKTREKLLFREYPHSPLCPARGITIGLPRALDFWGTMPFWSCFFRALGFSVKVSRPSSKKLFEKGRQFVASDTACFPAKLAHGHIADLSESGVDRIFMPMVNRVPSENGARESTFVCSLVKGYPIVIRHSDDPESRYRLPFDSPMFHWFTLKDRDFQLTRYMKETFAVPAKLTRAAIYQADGAQRAFKAELQAEGARVLEKVREDGGFAVVLAARHYQGDELVNHGLSRFFTNDEIPVLTLDSLPGIDEADLRGSRLDIVNNSHARLLSGAMIAAREAALEYAQIVSFGCGHDALLSDEITRIMGEISGKSPLILKLDESDASGPLHIRVKSFLQTVATRRKRQEEAPPRPLPEPFPVKFTKADKALRTILAPNVSAAFCRILSAAMRMQGFRVASLPLGGREAIRLGKKYVHNDICFPAQMVIGEVLLALQSGKYDPDRTAVGMAKFNCDCRLTNYAVLVRKALDEAGFSRVPIVTTDGADLKRIHPGFRVSPAFFARTVWCLVMTDILDELLRKIRPYERDAGAAQGAYDTAVEAICSGMEAGGVRRAIKEFGQAIDAFCALRYDRTTLKPMVFITGEYLLNFHPGSNFHVEEYLERNDMEVALPRMYDVFRKYTLATLSEMVDFRAARPFTEAAGAVIGNKLFDAALDLLEKIALRHPLYKACVRLPELAAMTDPIMHHSFNSGETYLIPADILHRAREGVRSFIILQPFGCLPNHICGRGVIKRLKELHPDIQVLPLDYDPDTSFANIENRLQMLIMNARNHA
ncbi:MAG: acyl-CoA dehydratase activase [Spirochaetaceae bacterium]|jgi:predicted CoA-substrate-specific enzyme activase|nr:acyl-CoA dehydratase activase [Spirochaetaceae bacterium]